MLSLHSNRNPKTEIVTRDMGIAVMGLTMFSFGGFGTLGLWVRKAVDNSKTFLMGHSSKSIEDSVAGGGLIF